MLFKDITGNQNTINKLIQTVKENRISHAQLFLGPEGSGKLALAIAYAQFINCENKIYYNISESELHADSCGVCKSCIKYQKLIHPDLHFVFPNTLTKKISKNNYSENFMNEWREFLIENHYYVSLNKWYEKLDVENKQGVINVRDCNEINRILSFKTYESDYKIMIIWMVEKLYHAAAPKILKILEEPPDKTIFLLISENQHQILPTILSRTQLVKMQKIEDEEIIKSLTNNFQLDKNDAASIASNADGNYFKAMELINQSEEENFNTEMMIKWLRNCYKGILPPFNEINKKDNTKKEMEGLNSIVGILAKIGREKQKNFLNYVIKIMRYSMLINFKKSNLVKTNTEEANFLKNFYPYINPENIENVFKELNNAIFHIERNANSNILFMDLSLKMHQFLNKTK